MLPATLIGASALLALIALIAKDRYELHRFEHRLDKIRMTPLIAVGRVAFYALFAEMAIFGTVLILNQGESPAYSTFLIHIPFEEGIQIAGMALMVLGFAFSFWSIMQIKGQELALTGPYRFVRHPIYLGCSVVAIGFLLTLLNVLALIPLLIIPAQAKAAKSEEDILIRRFGKRYTEYQERAGRMFPRRR